jgi:catechol 2,3-dioxygenase-like lactoylglutathione lyase family enzyme
MAKIRHIAITTENPEDVATFYKEAFDLHEVTRNERQVLLSDGYINLTILKWKTQQDPDVGPDGPNYSGIHHIGFQVDDLEASCEKLEKVEGKALTIRDVDTPEGTPRRQRAEAKWAGPDGVVIDVSQPGWAV